MATALAALEAAGLLSVANRLLRVRWKDELARVTRTRVMRTSNCYSFPTAARPAAPAEPSKSSFPTGTGIQVFNSDLFAALDRLKRGIRRGQAQDPDRLDGARNDKMAAAPERTEAAAKMVGSEGR